jgi:1-aminocyclopropane-1-carboxylate deaminase/D-cysteine desulfhydrase-like pyridoxal-dependent ACC family enzyme
MFLQLNHIPAITTINFQNIEIGILRLDLIDAEISGNKWFKLKHNLIEARHKEKTSIITFGGAFSNHISATAKACFLEGIKCIGLIRGESCAIDNPTLSRAKQLGMELIFLSREDYKKRNEKNFLDSLKEIYPESFIIPEGGNNELGELGCREILSKETEKYNKVFCAVGTGCTFNGIAKTILSHQTLTGINVLKYEARSKSISANINNHYHFGGYAKHHQVLIDFKNWFEKNYGITLDYVYTTKLFFAVFEMIKNNEIKLSDKCLVVHSGGLQGNAGYEKRYNLKPNL